MKKYSIYDLKKWYCERLGGNINSTKIPRRLKDYVYAELQLTKFTLINQLEQATAKERNTYQELMKLRNSNLHYRGQIARHPITQVVKWAQIQFELQREIDSAEFIHQLQKNLGKWKFQKSHEDFVKAASSQQQVVTEPEAMPKNHRRPPRAITLGAIDNLFDEVDTLRHNLDSSLSRHNTYLMEINAERLLNHELVSEWATFRLLEAVCISSNIIVDTNTDMKDKKI